jgi:type II secretory pathway component PulK
MNAASMRISRGSALLLSLWCVAVLSITVLAVARLVQNDVEDASRENKRFEARELALSGIALGMHPKIDPWDPLLMQQFPDHSRLRVRVISESARLDINRMLKEKDQATLSKLFDVWGAEPMEVSTAVDSLVDWIDANDLRQNNGAEKSDLERLPQYSIPANRDFHSVEEMEKVRGMDRIAALKPNWAEYFTVNGGRRIDLQDASIDVMRAGGLSVEQAKQVDLVRRGVDKEPQTRDDLKIKNATEFLRKIGLPELQLEAVQSKFNAGAGPMRIESRAELGGLEYRIVVIASRGGGENSLIAWDE